MGTADQLFEHIADGLWSVLESYRSQAAARLAGLGPEPGIADPVLKDRLLEPLRPDDIESPEPGVSALIKGLVQLLPDPVAGAQVRLHGFLAAAGQPRGLALVVATPGPAATFVIALTGDGPSGIAIELAATGAAAFNTATPLGTGWSLVLSGQAQPGGRLRFPRDGTASVPDGGTPLSVQFTLSYNGPPIVLGPTAGPHVTLGNVSVGWKTSLDASGNPKVSWTINLPEAQLSLVADVVAALLGDRLSIPMDLNLAADPELGFTVRGGGLRTTLPAHLSLPGVDISGVDFGLSIAGADVQFSFGVGFTASLPGFPLLSVTVTGLGASFPVSTGTSLLGLNVAGIRPTVPTGLGVDLALPVISGGGFLQSTGPGGYAGFLELNLLVLTIKAFALLQLPVPGKLLSFVAIISVEFPFPGIDLTFGFAVAGVGGIVGINRRLDREALVAAVVDGSASRLLFPVDAAAHGPAIVATLGRVFPEAPDHILVGPMLKITWGGRIVSMVVAVVVDLPNPLQLVVLGQVTVALPDPLAPLVFIRATFAGAFELSPTPSVSMVASLSGSYIAGMPLNGDIFFLVRGGKDADFVFSAGGFHPRYVPPKGVPANLQRLQLAMTPPGVPGLHAEAYFAVTTNTVQFGARLDLCDEIAGCGVDGWFSFDALFKWDPVFSFSIRASAGVAVQVFGETLMGVHFDLLLEGPAQWHVQGTGSVDLFLFSASLDFEHTWGPLPPATGLAKDLAEVLRTALKPPSAWIGAPPAGEVSVITLSASARNLVSQGHTVHPLGSVTVRQGAVPFDIRISRFQQVPIPPQTWSIAAAGSTPVRDSFPPGELLDLTEDEKLSKPAFEFWTSGAALSAPGEVHSDLRTWDTGYETVLIPDLTSIGKQEVSALAFSHESFLAVGDIHQRPDLWHALNLEVVTVLPSQPVSVVTTDTLTRPPGFISSGGFTETLQAAQAVFGTVGQAAAHQIVESWEIKQ
ncbi:MAG: DUF6603 domain-containing protein [Candidatus Solibacter sp.]